LKIDANQLPIDTSLNWESTIDIERSYTYTKEEMNVRFEKTENDSLEEECIPCNEAFMEKLD
jgi:hypothetical protein